MVPARVGWMLMEGASLVFFAVPFLMGANVKTAPMWVFFALWVVHYINRSIIFPLRITSRPMPAAIMGMGTCSASSTAG